MRKTSGQAVASIAAAARPSIAAGSTARLIGALAVTLGAAAATTNTTASDAPWRRFVTKSAPGEGSDYNAKIIEEFQANQGRIGWPRSLKRSARSCGS